MVSSPEMRLGIDVGNSEFLARKATSAAAALQQFVEMRLAQAARIAPVILRFRISQHHPHAWAFTPVHRVFLALGHVDAVALLA